MNKNTINQSTTLGEVTFQEYEEHDLVNKRTNLTLRSTLTHRFILTYTIQGEHINSILDYYETDEIAEEEHLNYAVRKKFADMLSKVMGISAITILPNLELSISDNSNLDVKIGFNLNTPQESRNLPFLKLVKALEPITNRLQEFDTSPEKSVLFLSVEREVSLDAQFATGNWITAKI